jgi:hypothetical protein
MDDLDVTLLEAGQLAEAARKGQKLYPALSETVAVVDDVVDVAQSAARPAHPLVPYAASAGKDVASSAAKNAKKVEIHKLSIEDWKQLQPAEQLVVVGAGAAVGGIAGLTGKIIYDIANNEPVDDKNGKMQEEQEDEAEEEKFEFDFEIVSTTTTTTTTRKPKVKKTTTTNAPIVKYIRTTTTTVPFIEQDDDYIFEIPRKSPEEEEDDRVLAQMKKWGDKKFGE